MDNHINFLTFYQLWTAWGRVYHIANWTPREWYLMATLRWRHNGRDGVSNHQPHDCLLNRVFRHRSKKTSKLCVTGLCAGNSPGTGEFPRKGPVTRKMFPFDDVIMQLFQDGWNSKATHPCSHLISDNRNTTSWTILWNSVIRKQTKGII